MARAQGVSLAFMTTLFICVIQRIGGASIDIHNKCSYTVWAAGSPGGGKALASGDSWTVQVELGSTSSISGRFWGRTGCSFDITGQGSCKTGDCGGLLSCQGSGKRPATMVEYEYEYDYEFYDRYTPPKFHVTGVLSLSISLVNGFNLPVSIIPSHHLCDAVTCSSNINAICPPELRVPDGCNSACTRFNTPQYCCTGKYSGNCSATKYSRIFKRQCPQAHTYPADNTAITSMCQGTTINITIVFCGDTATSLQGSPTMSPHGSPTMPPRSTNLPHPLTPLTVLTNICSAWNQFEQNQVLDIADPLLEGQYPPEQALRVITIALLCIQGSWTQRPAMSQVVSMLIDNSDRIAQPTRPAFIDAATDTPANFLPIPDSATQPAAPTPTSHGSISVSLLPR